MSGFGRHIVEKEQHGNASVTMVRGLFLPLRID